MLPNGTGEGILVAAGADGAGSAPKGDIGAAVAVAAALRHLRQAWTDGAPGPGTALREAAVAARDAVLSEAGSQDEDVRAFASTLLLLAIGPDAGAALQIGDGVIVTGDGTGGWSWLFWPQRGEFANTTYFLTDDGAEDRLQVGEIAGRPADVAVLTDGLEPLALHYATRSVHQPFFNGMFQPLVDAAGSEEIGPVSTSLSAFLSSGRIRARTDDDVSFIMATRRIAASGN